MKKVIGFNSLDILNKELNNLEREIRQINEIPIHQEISWGNSQRTDRAEYARYITYKHFSQKGEWLMLSKKLSLFSPS
jgi:hypothetical protein